MARVGSFLWDGFRFKLSSASDICLISFALILFLISCGERSNQTKFSADDIFLIKQALDSVEVAYDDPKAQKIIMRVYEKVKPEPGSDLFVRTLRLISTVLLSQPSPTLKQLDSAVSFSYEAKEIALLDNDSVEWALNEIQTGRYLFLRSYWLKELNQLPEASAVLLRGIHYLEKRNLTNGLSVAYHWLSAATPPENDGRSNKLAYEFRALFHNDSLRAPGLRAEICNEIAIFYSDYAKNFLKARVYFFRAATIFGHMEQASGLAMTLDKIAEAYIKEGNIIQGLSHFHQSARIANSAKLWGHEAMSLQKIAVVFQDNGRYDSARYYNKKAIKTLGFVPDYSNGKVIEWQAQVAKSYLKAGNRDFSWQLVDAFERKLPSIKNNELAATFSALEKMVLLYQDNVDLRKLAVMQKKLLTLRDLVFSKEQMIEVGRIESQYEIQLKDKELQVLQLSLSLQSENAKKEKWIRILLIVGIAVTTVGLVIVLRLLRQQNQFNQSLSERSEIIEQQKVELERNLTELQRTQGYMLTSEKMVMLGQFTAGVAHELNNPLNFISGGVSVLDDVIDKFLGRDSLSQERERTSTNLRAVLKNINNGVSRMAAIVESLQIFSNSKEAVTEHSEADVFECLEASLILIKSKLDRESVQVLKSYAPISVRGHSGRLSQVFINLIDNAIYALLKNPLTDRRLAITMVVTKQEVEINFVDNGEGIPEEIHRNIFHAFFTTKKTGQGTGLGLFICYNIVNDFGGKITFQSEIGRGSTFTVTLLRPKFAIENVT